jgi:hypothetical protein
MIYKNFTENCKLYSMTNVFDLNDETKILVDDLIISYFVIKRTK